MYWYEESWDEYAILLSCYSAIVVRSTPRVLSIRQWNLFHEKSLAILHSSYCIIRRGNSQNLGWNGFWSLAEGFTVGIECTKNRKIQRKSRYKILLPMSRKPRTAARTLNRSAKVKDPNASEYNAFVSSLFIVVFYLYCYAWERYIGSS